MMPVARELIISEITLMSQSFCVIGIERKEGRFTSVRPIPWNGSGWLQFQYDRGDRLSFDLAPMPLIPPHVEDLRAARPRKVGRLSETELVHFLRQAEVATSTRELFGCIVHAGANRGAYVFSRNANRSVCGCEITQISLHRQGNRIGATLALPAGDTLQNLPLVDRDWRYFIDALLERYTGMDNLDHRLQQFFNIFVRNEIANSPIRFIRIGLSREMAEIPGRNWLMLDSLFPLPKPEWLEAFGM